jgi:sortase A
MRFLGSIQRLLLILGALLIGLYVSAYLHKEVMYRAAMKRFEQIHVAQRLDESGQKVDFTLWSEKRIQAYEESLSVRFKPPMAILRISKVNLEVPVLEGTDDLTLNRGVGHIPGTGLPGEEGNIAIAGHRDGFFRVLKDIGPGDLIEIMTANRMDIYTVDQIVLTVPNDVSVLLPRPRPSLTLVTCYPFYFIGSAPKRYIVEASLKHSEPVFVSAERARQVAISEQ